MVVTVNCNIIVEGGSLEGRGHVPYPCENVKLQSSMKSPLLLLD